MMSEEHVVLCRKEAPQTPRNGWREVTLGERPIAPVLQRHCTRSQEFHPPGDKCQ